MQSAVAIEGSMQDAAGITRSEDEPVWSVPLPLINRAAELSCGFCWVWGGFSLYMFPIPLFNRNKYIYLQLQFVTKY